MHLLRIVLGQSCNSWARQKRVNEISLCKKHSSNRRPGRGRWQLLQCPIIRSAFTAVTTGAPQLKSRAKKSALSMLNSLNHVALFGKIFSKFILDFQLDALGQCNSEITAHEENKLSGEIKFDWP